MILKNNTCISPKERPRASGAPRAGAPAAQASPRPCNFTLNEWSATTLRRPTYLRYSLVKLLKNKLRLFKSKITFLFTSVSDLDFLVLGMVRRRYVGYTHVHFYMYR